MSPFRYFPEMIDAIVIVPFVRLVTRRARNHYRLATLLATGILAAALAQGAGIDSKDFSAADLFQITKVWNVELQFTQEQWNIMTPGRAIPGVAAPHSDGGEVFNWAHTAITIDGKKFDDIAIRYKGNQTFRVGRASGKISIKIDLNKYVKGQRLAGLTKLNFDNNINDPTWMREVLAFRFFRDAGVPAPRTSYARIYITVNGAVAHWYRGLFSVMEDVDENFIADRFGTKGGMLLKPMMTPVVTKIFQPQGNDWTAYEKQYNPKSPPSEAEKKRLMDFCQFVATAPDDRFAAEFGNWVELDAFVRYIAATSALANLDSIFDAGKNFYVWLDPRTQKFQFIPWDQDHTFGEYPSHIQRTLSIARPWAPGTRFMERVFGVPDFFKPYMAKVAEYRKTIFLPERMIGQADEIAPVIRPAVVEESPVATRLFDRAVSDVDTGTETLKAFVKARTKSVADQLDGKSAGEPYGFVQRMGPQ